MKVKTRTFFILWSLFCFGCGIFATIYLLFVVAALSSYTHQDTPEAHWAIVAIMLKNDYLIMMDNPSTDQSVTFQSGNTICVTAALTKVWDSRYNCHWWIGGIDKDDISCSDSGEIKITSRVSDNTLLQVFGYNNSAKQPESLTFRFYDNIALFSKSSLQESKMQNNMLRASVDLELRKLKLFKPAPSVGLFFS